MSADPLLVDPVEQLPLRPVLTLTEEELLVLTDGALGHVPPRVSLPAESEDTVRAVVVRCLMARGLVLPVGAGAEGVSWEVTEPLGLTLALRHGAHTVLALHRTLGPLATEAATGGGGTVGVRYLHLHEEMAVIEDVTEDGMHGLLTVFPERYQDAVAEFIRPPGAVPGHGQVRQLPETLRPGAEGPVEVPGAETAVGGFLHSLGDPTVIAEVAVARQGQVVGGTMLTFGPGGSYRSHDSRSYHPVDPDGAITDLVRSALPQEWGSGAGAEGPT